ncbi:collagen alpha-1(I) chain-like [Panthera pardus]|uniref:Collagen alpha-1(I) chain-like n=1 Tax=Panthera pardus TaxID=9691 RepID=A0A9W2V0B7_PANPR|nr:collagen alpha-1(I) chain-like [Panthera pardus]
MGRRGSVQHCLPLGTPPLHRWTGKQPPALKGGPQTLKGRRKTELELDRQWGRAAAAGAGGSDTQGLCHVTPSGYCESWRAPGGSGGTAGPGPDSREHRRARAMGRPGAGVNKPGSARGELEKQRQTTAAKGPAGYETLAKHRLTPAQARARRRPAAASIRARAGQGAEAETRSWELGARGSSASPGCWAPRGPELFIAPGHHVGATAGPHLREGFPRRKGTTQAGAGGDLGTGQGLQVGHSVGQGRPQGCPHTGDESTSHARDPGLLAPLSQASRQEDCVLGAKAPQEPPHTGSNPNNRFLPPVPAECPQPGWGPTGGELLSRVSQHSGPFRGQSRRLRIARWRRAQQEGSPELARCPSALLGPPHHTRGFDGAPGGVVLAQQTKRLAPRPPSRTVGHQHWPAPSPHQDGHDTPSLFKGQLIVGFNEDNATSSPRFNLGSRAHVTHPPEHPSPLQMPPDTPHPPDQPFLHLPAPPLRLDQSHRPGPSTLGPRRAGPRLIPFGPAQGLEPPPWALGHHCPSPGPSPPVLERTRLDSSVFPKFPGSASPSGAPASASAHEARLTLGGGKQCVQARLHPLPPAPLPSVPEAWLPASPRPTILEHRAAPHPSQPGPNLLPPAPGSQSGARDCTPADLPRHTFHISGIRHHVASGIWPRSLSTMLSRGVSAVIGDGAQQERCGTRHGGRSTNSHRRPFCRDPTLERDCGRRHTGWEHLVSPFPGSSGAPGCRGHRAGQGGTEVPAAGQAPPTSLRHPNALALSSPVRGHSLHLHRLPAPFPYTPPPGPSAASRARPLAPAPCPPAGASAGLGSPLRGTGRQRPGQASKLCCSSDYPAAKMEIMGRVLINQQGSVQTQGPGSTAASGEIHGRQPKSTTGHMKKPSHLGFASRGHGPPARVDESLSAARSMVRPHSPDKKTEAQEAQGQAQGDPETWQSRDRGSGLPRAMRKGHCPAEPRGHVESHLFNPCGTWDKAADLVLQLDRRREREAPPGYQPP